MVSIQALTPANPLALHECPAVHPTGGTRWHQWINRGYFGADGELIEIQSVGRDITDRREAEEAVHRSHRELERRIFESTEDLRRSNDDLKQCVIY
jgi:hypothetical protein